MHVKHAMVNRLGRLGLALALVALMLSAGASAQSNKPISRKGLVDSVRINGLPTPELVRIIERRGVDFEMTADAESELRRVGARPEIIETARSNYRAPRATTPATSNVSRPAANTNPVNASVPAGPPLGKSEIITMLQAGASPARVEQFVEARGVNFQMTPEIAREVNAAGGNRSLVGAITERATAVETASSNSSFGRDDDDHDDGADAAPAYDDFIDRANSAISVNDFAGAIRHLQQAAQFDPSQPTAYSMLGTLVLYFQQDVGSAERAMRAALERNGAAAFHVYHDHDGSFNNFCEGSFFVTRTGVSFKANDGQHTFETADSNIKEAKTNAFVGAQYGAFHIKPVQKINNRDNFNFAPLSRQKAESQLLLRLIQAY